MIDTVHFTPATWQAITSASHGATVFALAQPESVGLRVYDHRVLPKAAFGDAQRQALLGWASGEGAVLVEAHAHLPGTPACMSAIDLEGLADWVPHVRWRLGGRPYAALVHAGATVDGLAWSDDDARASRVEHVGVGPARLRTTGRSIQRLHEEDARA